MKQISISIFIILFLSCTNKADESPLQEIKKEIPSDWAVVSLDSIFQIAFPKTPSQKSDEHQTTFAYEGESEIFTVYLIDVSADVVFQEMKGSNLPAYYEAFAEKIGQGYRKEKSNVQTVKVGTKKGVLVEMSSSGGAKGFLKIFSHGDQLYALLANSYIADNPEFMEQKDIFLTSFELK